MSEDNWNMPHDKEEWNPPKFRCKKCDQIIFSRWPGHFVMCECKSIFVDQTRHYSRYGGNPKDFEEVEDE